MLTFIAKAALRLPEMTEKMARWRGLSAAPLFCPVCHTEQRADMVGRDKSMSARRRGISEAQADG